LICLTLCIRLYCDRDRSTCLFFFTDTPPPEIYTLSLHDALPISTTDDLIARLRAELKEAAAAKRPVTAAVARHSMGGQSLPRDGDRKSTRLNSSHVKISYAVFCLKKKKQTTEQKYDN